VTTAGDVLLVDLDPVAGNEQGGLRPVIVISNSGYNQLVAGRLLVACPVTSRNRGLAHHVPVTLGPTHRLDRPSWVMCEQPRTISSRRVNRSIGTLIAADVDRVAMVVRRLLYSG
jgi:mRNA interferase MazF